GPWGPARCAAAPRARGPPVRAADRARTAGAERPGRGGGSGRHGGGMAGVAGHGAQPHPGRARQARGVVAARRGGAGPPVVPRGAGGPADPPRSSILTMTMSVEDLTLSHGNARHRHGETTMPTTYS